ncbi:MAG: type II secretion system minor pseudopilin GspH [Magnetococcales bacterium]|nr:type II secretion system minor pseudopilin GspH [Magnetococcales bacterium]
MTRFDRCRDGGFTLAEVMVVLLIMGITLGLAVVSMGSHGRDRRVEDEVLRIRGLFALAGREAVLGMREWGVRISEAGYGFLVLDEANLWRPPEGEERLLRPRHLPPEMRFRLRVEGRPGGNGLPQVIFSSDGRVTPFVLEALVDGKPAWRLTGEARGGMRLARAPAS